MGVPTLEEAKEWLAVDFDDDDAIINDCIAAAKSLVAEHVGVAFSGTLSRWVDVRYRIKRHGINATKRREFESPTGLTLRGITTNDDLVKYTTTSGFSVLDSPWHIDLFIPEAIWDAFDAVIDDGSSINTAEPVQAALTVGIADADVTAAEKQAMRFLIAEFYSNRGDMPPGKYKSVSEIYLGKIVPRI